MHGSLYLTVALLSLLSPRAAFSQAYQVDHSKSLFAIVTHKAGIAKAAAHNHLIHAESPTVNMVVKDNLVDSSFDFSAKVQDLVVDDPHMQKTWDARIQSIGIATGFSQIDESDRSDIRESMLDEGQLNAAKFPTITAKITALKTHTATVGEVSATHIADLQVTIHGTTVSREIPCRIQKQAGGIEVIAKGQFKFTEFQIEPFSALFGAIGNQDAFDVFVAIKAGPQNG